MMDINYERIGSRLREARKAKGLTQKDVAEHLDIETNSYSNLERGAQPINLKRLVDLCVLYGIKPGYLLDDCCAELIQIDNTLPQSASEEHRLLFKLIEGSSDKVRRVLLTLALSLQENEDSL